MAPCFIWLCVALLLLVRHVQGDSCTSYDDESGTCYIDRTQKWISSHGAISCDSRYPNCVITCDGDKYSCGSDQDTVFPFIICGVHGTECTINCASNEACYGSTIYSGNHSFVHINIDGMDQSKMEIHAPNHGALNIHLRSAKTSFTNNRIHAAPSTTAIHMDCRHGISCNKNTINGQHVTSSLVYKCDSYCDSTRILCPSDAPCDIQCRNSCNNLLISSDDITQLHILCDYKQCKNTMIECVINDTVHQSQFISNYNKNGVGSLVGHCTDASTIEHIEFSADLDVYIYYNQSDVSSDLFTKLMHDAIIETYQIISDNDQKHDAISGHIINITFCVMFNQIVSNQCGALDITTDVNFESTQHNSQFVAFGLFNIVSTNTDMMLFKAYVMNILSSDKFMTYFAQTMNVKLFQTNDFYPLAINIDDSIIVTNHGDNDEDISAVSHASAPYPAHMIVVFIIIGLCGGTICSILCGYSVHKWCNSEYLLTKLQNDTDDIQRPEPPQKQQHEIEPQPDDTDSDTDINEDANMQQMFNKTNGNKLRAIHWGFTNGNDKYGEVSKFNHKDPPSPSGSIPQANEQRRRHTYTVSHDVHRPSRSTRGMSMDSSTPKPSEVGPLPRVSIASRDDAIQSIPPIPTVTVAAGDIISDDGNLYEDDAYKFDHQQSQTFNMERALKQNSFQHKYKRLRHFKSMKSISSVEIEDLFSSPTVSHLEGPKIGKGHTMAASYDAMCNYGAFHCTNDSEHMYANTMPAFSLHPIEISQINAIEKMDDDFDDYDERNHSHETNNSDNSEPNELRSMNQSSSPKPGKLMRDSHSMSRTPTPNDDSSNDSILDDFVTPTITPLLGPQYGLRENINNDKRRVMGNGRDNEDKLRKLSDDTEPELPLSPCHSPTAGNTGGFVCNAQIQKDGNRCMVVHIHDTAECLKYDTSSFSSTNL